MVPNGENLRVKGVTAPKTGGDQSEKSNEKRAHRSDHDPTNDRKLCVSDPTEFSVSTGLCRLPAAKDWNRPSMLAAWVVAP